MRKYFFLLFFIGNIFLFAQVENVPANSLVYNFLEHLYTKGALSNYDITILPLSVKDIQNLLDSVTAEKLSAVELDQLNNYKSKYNYYLNSSEYTLQKINSTLNYDYPLSVYRYKDSSVSFNVFPQLEFSYINSASKSASLLLYGLNITGGYSDWLGYNISFSNGNVFGNSIAAQSDNRVKQSFTFNDTKINYFDNTSGYIKIKNDFADLQIGRERILWGNSTNFRMFLSDNPPLFDFVKAGFHYKNLRYDYIHSWLVSPREIVRIDTISYDIKKKMPKYSALSRFSYNTNDFKFGFSQMIIYGDRPFELSYLNPFLLWESAQRSQNDLDNSFWGFDASLKIIDGIKISANIIIDDINFDKYLKGKWNNVSNAGVLQFSGEFTIPIIISNSTLFLDYIIVRPYMFSHYGINQVLAYTSNSYLLSEDIQPNSLLFSASFTNYLSKNLQASVRFKYIIHGRNTYDEQGRIIKNYGGNVFEHFTANDSENAYLLAGDKEKKSEFSIKLSYQLKQNLYLDGIFNYETQEKKKDIVLSLKTYPF